MFNGLNKNTKTRADIIHEMDILKNNINENKKELDKHGAKTNTPVSRQIMNEIERDLDKYDELQKEVETMDKTAINNIKKQQKNENVISTSNLLKLNNFKSIDDFNSHFKGESLNSSKFFKGALFNDWQGADNELKAFRNKVDGTVIMPESIAREVIYNAKNKSIFLENCPVVIMDTEKVKIGRIKDDVELDFKAKYETGKETGLGLEGVELISKTLYGWIEVSEEELQDIENLGEVIGNAFALAVGETIDKNFMYNNPKATENSEIYPSGVLDSKDINTIKVDSVNWDMIGRACLEVSKHNGKVNTVGLNPEEHFSLLMTKDSTGQYVRKPEFMEEINNIDSNTLKKNEGIAFDSNQVVVGIRDDINFALQQDLKKGTMIMRCRLRADVAIAKESHIVKILVESKE